MLGVEVVGRTDDDAVEIGLLAQQVAKVPQILVLGQRIGRSVMGAINRVDAWQAQSQQRTLSDLLLLYRFTLASSDLI